MYVVFTDTGTDSTSFYHYAACMVLVYFPWMPYFNRSTDMFEYFFSL